MSPLVVFILFFVFLLIAIPSLYPLVWLQYYQEYLIRLLQQVLPTLSVLCLVESTVSHSLQYRCLFYPVLLWQEVEFLRDYLISFHISLEKRTAGLPCAAVITCLFYGAISGSGIATVAAVGSMTIPLLVELGYDKKFCTALVAVAGSLGVIIPPSIPFIMYGMASGASVSDIFLAGIVPGVLIGLLLMVYAVFYCKKHGEDKEKINAKIDDLHAQGLWKYLRAVSLQCCLQSLSLDVFTPVLPRLQKQPLSLYSTH